MVFSSLTFLYLFLPAVLLAYYAAPPRWRNGVLLISSLLFYFFGEPRYTPLLLLSSVSDYAHSLVIERRRGMWQAKAALISSIAINLAMLGCFKYADFLVANWNALTGSHIPQPGLPLPVGISFFTFQTMSYTIDVYRGEVHAERDLPTLATYVCLFPQLVAGPIVRYSAIASELHDRRHTVAGAAQGIRRLTLGLGKKVLLANAMGELCAAYRGAAQPSTLYCWLYAVGFTLQIYFDFSGYSDMAIGLGRLFGFSFPENFRYPYVSRSVTEFWRRWHISLSSWFRDYVYIPLGGSRVGIARRVRNLLIVWFLTGLWHGAAWNFILWGLWFGVALLAEKYILGSALERLPSPLRWAWTMLLVILGFVLFNAASLDEAWSDFRGLFGIGIPAASGEAWYQLRNYGLLMAIAALGATPLPRRWAARWAERRPRGFAVVEPLALGALILLATAYLVDGSFNPFLYFRF